VRAGIPTAQVNGIIEEAVDTRRKGYAEGPNPDGTVWSAAFPLPADILSSPVVISVAGPTETPLDQKGEARDLLRQAIREWSKGAWALPVPVR
jgi:hypothetical protein